MKRHFSSELAVGTFALLGLLVIIYMSLKVNDRGDIGGATVAYTARFESVTGLVRKVPVEVAGIIVGFVDDIRLEGNRALVTVRVRGEVPIYSDASLAVRDRGILGDRFLSLDPGSPDGPRIAPGGEIKKTSSGSDIEKLTSMVTSLGESLEEVLRSDEPRGALGGVIRNLRDLTEQMKGLVGANEERISGILSNIETFSADLSEIGSANKENLATLIASLRDVSVSLREMLASDGRVRSAAEKLDETMASVNRIAEKIERGEGTLGRLISDDSTIEKVNEAVDGVNEALSAYRKLSLGVRYRGEFLTSAKEMQSLAGISLAPSPDKYVLFEVVDTPVGRTEVIDTTVTSDGTVLSRTQTIRTSDRFVFTFLLAKRFWDLNFRFGLMRSNGGVGIDYHLFRDKFTLSFEAFDFSRPNNRAHLRAYGTLVIYKHLLLTGGLDDMATSSGSRQPFFGGGIQFTDEDLKSLAGAMTKLF